MCLSSKGSDPVKFSGLSKSFCFVVVSNPRVDCTVPLGMGNASILHKEGFILNFLLPHSLFTLPSRAEFPILQKLPVKNFPFYIHLPSCM